MRLKRYQKGGYKMAIGLYIVWSRSEPSEIIGVFTDSNEAEKCSKKHGGFVSCDEAYDSLTEWEHCQLF